MAKKVDIPVEVTGATKARDELKKTRQSVTDVGTAGVDQAQSAQRAAAAQGQSAASASSAASATQSGASAQTRGAEAAGDMANAQAHVAKEAGKAAREMDKAAAAARRAQSGKVLLKPQTDGLVELTDAHKKAAPAIKQTAQATNQFDDSAKTAITGILGQFNPMLASMANIGVDVAKGIKGISGALLGMVGAGAAIAGVIAFFQSIRNEIQKTKKEAEEFQQQIDKIRDKFTTSQERMATTLQSYNALTPETEKAAGEMRRRMERAGFARDTAEKTAPMAVMGGLDFSEAKLAAQLGVTGAQFDKPSDIRPTIDKLRETKPNMIADAERQIAALSKTQTAIKRRIAAGPQPVGAVQHSAEELTREGLIGAGTIPEDMPLADLRALLDEAENLANALKHMEDKGVIGVERRHAYPAEAWGGESLITRQKVRERMREIRGHQLLRARDIAKGAEFSPSEDIPSRIPQAAERGAQVAEAVQQITNHYNTTITQGTVHVYDRNGILGGGEALPIDVFEGGTLD